MKSYLPLLAIGLFLLPFVGEAGSQVTKTLSANNYFNDTSSCLADRTSFLQTQYSDRGEQPTQDQDLCSCFQTVAQQKAVGKCNNFPYQVAWSNYYWEGIYTITTIKDNADTGCPAGTQSDSFGGTLHCVPTSSGSNSNQSNFQGGGTNPSGSTFGGGTNPSPSAPSGTQIIDNPLKVGSLGDFLLAILHFITRTVGPIVVILMLVYVGVLFATASFRPDNIQRAREALLYTLIGALILLGAEAIAIGIQQTVQAFAGG